MIGAEVIAKFFGVNYRVIQRQLDGLTHEDSLLQLPFRGNCLNWVLGHIIASRNGVLNLLGEASIWNDEEAAPYISGSEPITGPESPHLHLEKIMAALEQSQAQILAALERTSQEALNQPDGDGTVGDSLSFLYWHEAYHVGQTEYLRQLAGKNDKVI